MCLYLMSFSMHTKPLYKTSYQQIKKVETKKRFPADHQLLTKIFPHIIDYLYFCKKIEKEK